MSEDDARALEAERAKPMPSSVNRDERALELILEAEKGDGSPARMRGYQALRRKIAWLRKDGNISFRALVKQLVNAEFAARSGKL
jgi:hypothetical protein